jgi:ABC-type transport system substrate-binding protein
MGDRAKRFGLVAVLTLFALACQPAQPRPPASGGAAPAGNAAPAGQAAPANSDGPTRVSIGVTETIESQNPYTDSISLGYGIWCEVIGCLMTMDPKTNTYKPQLAEKWEVQ